MRPGLGGGEGIVVKKIRYLPFGYRIANGNYEIVQEERQLVRQIFSQYLEGSSLLQLAEMAQRSGIPYRENAARWNKNMIARMLDDTRYWQDHRLPPLVDGETTAAVNAPSPSDTKPVISGRAPNPPSRPTTPRLGAEPPLSLPRFPGIVIPTKSVPRPSCSIRLTVMFPLPHFFPM